MRNIITYLQTQDSFNRTIVELKLLSSQIDVNKAQAFNRTIVELKLINVACIVSGFRLLIVLS